MDKTEDEEENFVELICFFPVFVGSRPEHRLPGLCGKHLEPAESYHWPQNLQF